MADSKISALADGGGLAAGDKLAVARAGASYRASPIGVPVLVYRYTVVGSDKTSIDTGVDTPDAGSNDWTNGDLLEIFIVSRTDEAAASAFLAVTFNNDTANNYIGLAVYSVGAAPTFTSYAARANVPCISHGSSGSAFPGESRIIVPNYAGTVFAKPLETVDNCPDATTGNKQVELQGFVWNSTAAINRLAVTPLTAGKKLKIGSQLLIYKRLAS